MKLKKLIQDRKAAMDKINAMLALAEEEKREFTDEENTKFDTLRNKVDDLDEKINRQREIDSANERQQELENHMSQVPGPRNLNDPENGGDLNEQERADLAGYSMVRACCAALPNNQLEGIELEMHQEAVREARECGRSVQGVGIPQMVLAHAGVRHRNDLSAGTDSEGGHTVATQVRPLIDILREKLMVRELGATVFNDLVGNMSFPRAVSDSDPAEKAEKATSDENSPTFEAVPMNPKRLPTHVEVTKLLLMQSSTDIEAWLRRYIAFRIASRMDKMALNGSGTGNEPRGIINTVGLNLVPHGANGGAPTADLGIDLEELVSTDNADMGTLAYLTTPGVRKKLKATKIDPGSAEMVWPRKGKGEVEGYRAEVSTNVPSNLTKGTGTNLHAAIFGNWASLFIGQWGGLDILVDPYTKGAEGMIRLIAESYYDLGIEHIESFAAAVDLDLS